MWKSPKNCVFPHVFPLGNSRIRLLIDVQKFTSPLEFPHVEIHQKMSIYCCTLGNPQLLVYFHMRKFMISCEFPHGDRRISAGADLHILLCISTCGNSLKTVQIRVRGNTLFLMWEFTLNCVSLLAVIHQNLCKSARQIYTFSSAFPQVEIHNYKCRSTYAEN